MGTVKSIVNAQDNTRIKIYIFHKIKRDTCKLLSEITSISRDRFS